MQEKIVEVGTSRSYCSQWSLYQSLSVQDWKVSQPKMRRNKLENAITRIWYRPGSLLDYLYSAVVSFQYSFMVLCSVVVHVLDLGFSSHIG